MALLAELVLFKNIDILVKSKHTILFSEFFFFTKMGNVLRLWDTFDNVENGTNIIGPLENLRLCTIP